MGTFHPGVFGPFNGKVGSVVASKWKGIRVVRNTPEKTNRKKSELQLHHTFQFSLVTNFLKRAAGHTPVGYRWVTGAVTPYNVAFKYHLNEAVTGTYPDYQIDYPKVKLSLDDSLMDYPSEPSIVALADGVVKISWKLDANANPTTLASDKAYIMLYNANKKKSINSYGKFLRSSLSIDFLMPGDYPGDVLHCWLFFVSTDGKLVSETSYLGSVTVLE